MKGTRERSYGAVQGRQRQEPGGERDTWGVRIPATRRGSAELSPEHFDQNGDCLLSYLHEAFLPPGNEDPQGRTLKEI